MNVRPPYPAAIPMWLRSYEDLGLRCGGSNANAAVNPAQREQSRALTTRQMAVRLVNQQHSFPARLAWPFRARNSVLHSFHPIRRALNGSEAM